MMGCTFRRGRGSCEASRGLYRPLSGSLLTSFPAGSSSACFLIMSLVCARVSIFCFSACFSTCPPTADLLHQRFRQPAAHFHWSWTPGQGHSEPDSVSHVGSVFVFSYKLIPTSFLFEPLFSHRPVFLSPVASYANIKLTRPSPGPETSH